MAEKNHNFRCIETLKNNLCWNLQPLSIWRKIYTFFPRKFSLEMMDQICLKVAIEKGEEAFDERWCLPQFLSSFVFPSSSSTGWRGAGLTWMTKFSRLEDVENLGTVPVIWIVWEGSTWYNPLPLVLGSVCPLERQERSSWVKIRDQPAQSPPFGSGYVQRLMGKKEWGKSVRHLFPCALPASGYDWAWDFLSLMGFGWLVTLKGSLPSTSAVSTGPMSEPTASFSKVYFSLGLLRLRTTSLEEKKANFSLPHCSCLLLLDTQLSFDSNDNDISVAQQLSTACGAWSMLGLLQPKN